MFKHLSKANKIESICMMLLYMVDMLAGICYLYFMWADDYWITDAPFFIIFYTFACGARIMLDVLLITNFGLKRISTSIILLMVFCILQSVTLIVNIVYEIMYDGFWEDKYVNLILEAALILSYLRRHFTLREIRNVFKSEREGDF